MNYPRSCDPYPMKLIDKQVIYLKNFISNPLIEVGDYTYYHDVHHPENFEKQNVFYLYTCKLIIGKFCQIAQGTTFIMSDANHQIDGFSTYPFSVFGGNWADFEPNFLKKGDTVIGNDVWFGYQSVILPGMHIGDGAIIGACSVVTKDVPPYTVVGGNPAKIIRQRFDPETIVKLQSIQWWNWDIEKITRNLRAITGVDIKQLQKCV